MDLEQVQLAADHTKRPACDGPLTVDGKLTWWDLQRTARQMSFTLSWFLVLKFWAGKFAFITIWSSAEFLRSAVDFHWSSLNVTSPILKMHFYVLWQMHEANVMVKVYCTTLPRTNEPVVYVKLPHHSKRMNKWCNCYINAFLLPLLYLFTLSQSLVWHMPSFSFSQRSHNKTKIKSQAFQNHFWKDCVKLYKGLI